MLEGGVDIRVIHEIRGHAEMSTTAIYTRVSIKHLKAVHATRRIRPPSWCAECASPPSPLSMRRRQPPMSCSPRSRARPTTTRTVPRLLAEHVVDGLGGHDALRPRPELLVAGAIQLRDRLGGQAAWRDVLRA